MTALCLALDILIHMWFDCFIEAHALSIYYRKTDMGWFIFAIILAVVSVVALFIAIGAKASASSDSYSGDKALAHAVSRGGFVVFGVGLLITIGCLFASMFYQNGVGEAKVVVNSFDKKVVRTIDTPGAGLKAPWEDFIEFDVFSQEVTFAGNGDEAPSYTGGKVSGKAITVNVGGVSGGSTRADIDLSATYSVDESKVSDIYADYRSQERFTEQIVQKQLLSIARQVPSEYSAVDFRGAKRGEAEQVILSRLNEKLKDYGVEFTTLTIQDVRYPESVETALTQIEEANQAAQKAEADKRTAEVNAEKALVEATGVANAQIEKARGEAEANRLLSESLTPAVIELRRIEALQKAAENGSIIIDGGNGDLLLDARN